MNAWRELVIENPMLIEIRRFRRRMLSTRGGGGNIAALLLVLVFYAIIVLAIMTAARDIEPVAIVMAQTIMFSLLLPVMVSGAIAGEREKRTWDILLVAPVTKAQIVVGKFVASLFGLGVFFLACLLPVIGCVVANRGASVSLTISAEILSASFGILLIGLSLFISARSRTTFAALGACIGLVFTVLGAVPVFTNVVLEETGRTLLERVYVFSTLYRMADHSRIAGSESIWIIPLVNSAIYICLTAALLAAATASVRKMEEIKNVMPESEGKVAKSHA